MHENEQRLHLIKIMFQNMDELILPLSLLLCSFSGGIIHLIGVKMPTPSCGDKSSARVLLRKERERRKSLSNSSLCKQRCHQPNLGLLSFLPRARTGIRRLNLILPEGVVVGQVGDQVRNGAAH